MSLELERAQTVTIGSRCYRKYPIKVDLPKLEFKSRYSVDLTYDDDEDSGVEALPVNDKGNYEDLMQELEEEFKDEESATSALVETVFYDSRFKTYTTQLRIGQNLLFYQIFGKVASAISEQQRYIESCSGAILKPVFKDMSVEIRSSQPLQTIRAHSMLLDIMKKMPELRPTEYQVVDERSRKVLSSHRPQDLVQPQAPADSPPTDVSVPALLEERLDFLIRKDNKRSRFTYHLTPLPDICIKTLLKDSASVLRQAKQELGHRCDIYVNKQHRRLEFSGQSEADVRDAYALIIKTFNSVPEAVQALNTGVKGYTHFLAMSFMHDPDLVPVSQQILDCDIPNLGLVTAPGKLHITMGMLSLDSEESIAKAKDAFLAVVTQRETVPLVVHFKRLNYFGKPTQASVLYLEPEESESFAPIKRVNYALLKRLLDDGLFPESELKTQHMIFNPEKFAATYHLTLVKTVKSKGRNSLMDIRNALAKNQSVDVTARVKKLGLYELSKGETEDYRPIVEVET